jgi:predicted NBD/HSP70 family sugar kinase
LPKACLHVKKVLVVDVGGSNVKLFLTGHRGRVKIPSGPELTPRRMVKDVLAATDGWDYDMVSIGYPGPVVRGKIAREPQNLGNGWVRFDFARAFERPVRLINDAAMQALGSYRGRTMLFLGLGTGLGTTLVHDGMIIPLEMAHLPYRNGRTFEAYIGQAGRIELGLKRWRRHVAIVVDLMLKALVADYAVVGGGNARLLDELPPRTRRGSNVNAFHGGERLWEDDVTCT